MASISRTVVVLKKPKGTEDPYSLAFQNAGYTPHFIQVLHFEYHNEQELLSSLLNSQKFSGIVFTSQTAVESVHHALSTVKKKEEDIAELWKDLPVFVVGKATAQAVMKLGLNVTGSFSGNADALSQVIIEYFKPPQRDSLKPLLFPCGNLRKETLPVAMEKARIKLHSVICYTTQPDPIIAEKTGELRQKVPDERWWVVFFSPSGVSFALEHIRATNKQNKFAAIGKTTADALEREGVKVHAVASKPNPESLLEAIITADNAT